MIQAKKFVWTRVRIPTAPHAFVLLFFVPVRAGTFYGAEMESTGNGWSEEKHRSNKRQYTCHGFTLSGSGGVESGPVGEMVLTPLF